MLWERMGSMMTPNNIAGEITERVMKRIVDGAGIAKTYENNSSYLHGAYNRFYEAIYEQLKAELMQAAETADKVEEITKQPEPIPYKQAGKRYTEKEIKRATRRRGTRATNRKKR